MALIFPRKKLPMISVRRPFSGTRTAFFAALICILTAGGCATASKDDSDAKYRSITEETMPEPYIPRDDGMPLTPEELRAFRTVGDLDRKLGTEDAHVVELHFKYFVHQQRASFERFLERASRFLPYIKKVFNDRGIPGDIAYLFMIESGGNPNAVSRAGAVGLWQFMPFTGRKFGLVQNNWIDERRDPYKSTYAASDYLLKLYGDFAEWNLAVAAYNAGEGKIGRAVSDTGAMDFFDLCRLDGQREERARLKAETRDYVPRLIAVSKIMRNLNLLGFSDPSPDAAWNLTPVTVPQGTNLSALARRLDLAWDEFSGMNPAFRRAASPPTHQSSAYVPPDKAADASLWLAGKESRIYVGWKEYRVKKGDSLASIAKRNNLSVAAIREANGFSSLPKPGTVILLPGGGQKAAAVHAAPPEKAASPGAGVYVVRSGDTLFSLARRWGTDVAAIRAANRLDESSVLKPGMRVKIPGNSKGKAGAPAPGKNTATRAGNQTYTVCPGDTLYSIARANNVSPQALRKTNRLDAKGRIRPGQKLLLP
ncbi:MAG: LysM peptidoglycan-binding domain-containing protein [Desulfovibrio sp.]|jgi:membrane-bound lytic murein transglycosylase D|nr:LysM peptidoglycan-binding domain-containing protein [Desulfovibrio sp.]